MAKIIKSTLCEKGQETRSGIDEEWLFFKCVLDNMKRNGVLTPSQWYRCIIATRKMLGFPTFG